MSGSCSLSVHVLQSAAGGILRLLTDPFLVSEGGGNRCAAVISHEMDDVLWMKQSWANKVLKWAKLKREAGSIRYKKIPAVRCACPSLTERSTFDREALKIYSENGIHFILVFWTRIYHTSTNTFSNCCVLQFHWSWCHDCWHW